MAQWVIKSTSCSSRQPGFRCQYLYDGLQLSVTLVLANPVSFSGSQVPGTHVVHTYTCRQSTHTHKIF